MGPWSASGDALVPLARAFVPVFAEGTSTSIPTDFSELYSARDILSPGSKGMRFGQAGSLLFLGLLSKQRGSGQKVHVRDALVFSNMKSPEVTTPSFFAPISTLHLNTCGVDVRVLEPRA
jgi:hypothetical protein